MSPELIALAAFLVFPFAILGVIALARVEYQWRARRRRLRAERELPVAPVFDLRTYADLRPERSVDDGRHRRAMRGRL